VSALDTAAIAEIANKPGAAGELAARGELSKRVLKQNQISPKTYQLTSSPLLPIFEE
jgi:hypothetical protein